MYTVRDYKTKKELKEAVAKGGNIMGKKKNLIEKQRTFLLRELRKWEQKNGNTHLLFHVSISELPGEGVGFYAAASAFKFYYKGKHVLSKTLGEWDHVWGFGTDVVRVFIDEFTANGNDLVNQGRYTEEEVTSTVTLELIDINKTGYRSLPGLADLFHDAICNLVDSLYREGAEGDHTCTQ